MAKSCNWSISLLIGILAITLPLLQTLFFYRSLTISSVQTQPEQAVCNFKKATGVLTTAHGTVLPLDCPQAIVDTCRNGSKTFWNVPDYAIEGPNIPKADSRKQDAM